ncbi:MAG: lipocalin family protein [Pyrinomonadaceae bacterium]
MSKKIAAAGLLMLFAALIIELAPDYTYALVGDPGRKYLWILSRTPQLDEATYRRLAEAARSQGFDVSRLIRTKQG